jgi:DNA-binding response OmpR family regulator
LKTILIADDDVHTRQLVRETLSEPDFRIIDVENGKQALAYLTAQKPDLLVLDWMMPGLSGLEVAREAHRISPSVPILMLTAKHQRMDIALARDAGVAHYLTKPFSPLELITRVKSMVQ